MWEGDKVLHSTLTQCIETTKEELASGEDVDYETICIVEMSKLEKMIGKRIEYYQNSHPMIVAEGKQKFWQPRMPYFQKF